MEQSLRLTICLGILKNIRFNFLPLKKGPALLPYDHFPLSFNAYSTKIYVLNVLLLTTKKVLKEKFSVERRKGKEELYINNNNNIIKLL